MTGLNVQTDVQHCLVGTINLIASLFRTHFVCPADGLSHALQGCQVTFGTPPSNPESLRIRLAKPQYIKWPYHQKEHRDNQQVAHTEKQGDHARMESRRGTHPQVV